MAHSPTPPPTTPTTMSSDVPSTGPAPRRPRRVAGPILLVVALLAGGIALVIGLDSPDEPRRPVVDPAFQVPELAPEPGSAVPAVASVGSNGTRSTESRPTAAAVRDWATGLSEKTEIPVRSLVAYAEAELAVREATPNCKITWATLAGVGRVESHHGRYGGSEIGDDGQLTPPIIGIPLDGSPGVQAIVDTDGGRLDGDTTWDRAVGAMQFLPTTWERWGARAEADGAEPNPQDIDDAALSAARYLCASGGDLSSPAGWWQAVMTYNESVTYGQNVFSGAEAYAKAAG